METDRGFRFEADFMEDGMRCIPMAARLRLDLCRIKLRLSEWSKMTDSEKKKVAQWPYNLPLQMDACRDFLKAIVFRRTGREATILETTADVTWSDTSRVPEAVEAKMSEFNWTLSIEEWRTLTELQRFALMKLTRPGHENRNFPRAVVEFRQKQLVPVI